MRQEGGCCRISGLTHRSEDSICKQDRKSGPVSLYLITKMSSVTARCLLMVFHACPFACKEQLMANHGIIQLSFLSFSHKPECILANLENDPLFNLSAAFIEEFLAVLQFHKTCVSRFWRIDAYLSFFPAPSFWMSYFTRCLMYFLNTRQILLAGSICELLRAYFCMLKTAGITGW